MDEQDVVSTDDHLFHQTCDLEPPAYSSDSLSMRHADTHGQLLMIRNSEKTITEVFGTSELSLATSDHPSTEGSSCHQMSLSVSETQQLELNPSTGVFELPVSDSGPPQNSTSDTQSVKSRDDQHLAHKVSTPSDCGVVSSQSLTCASDKLIVSNSLSSLSADSDAVNTTSVDTTRACDSGGPHLPVANNNQSLFVHPVSESFSAENIQPLPSEPPVVCTLLVYGFHIRLPLNALALLVGPRRSFGLYIKHYS